MGKRWQEKIGGRWRTVTACAKCGQTVQVTQLGSHPFVDCGVAAKLPDAYPEIVRVTQTGASRIDPLQEHGRIAARRGLHPWQVSVVERLQTIEDNQIEWRQGSGKTRAMNFTIPADADPEMLEMLRSGTDRPASIGYYRHDDQLHASSVALLAFRKREREFTARHFRIALGVCGAIALLGCAWAWYCGWRG